MKKLLAFIVLLVHMNFTMFLPQVKEVDQYDAGGLAMDDINSLAEYIDQVVLSHRDATPEDEDDDSEHCFQVERAGCYDYIPQTAAFIKPCLNRGEKTKYPSLRENRPASLFFEIQLPPPKA